VGGKVLSVEREPIFALGIYSIFYTISDCFEG